MDPKEKDYDADAVLAELRESLKNINEPKSTIESEFEATALNLSGYDYTINNDQDTITLTSSKYSNATGGYSFGGFTTGASNGPYTISGGVSNTSPWATSINASTKIHLEGEDADIEINGKSLAKTIQALEERLNVLNINPELEKEWAELKELGDKYRALETKLKEQGKMWEKLKEMPPPTQLY